MSSLLSLRDTYKTAHNNIFSFVFGILCLSVVYIHSGWADGFDKYNFNTGIHTLSQVMSAIFLTTVPSFFILWGYLSHKYLYDNEPWDKFLKRKIIKFYPLYMVSFLISLILNPDLLNLQLPKLIFGFLGLYYQSGFTGGNIYLVVIYVLLTVSAFKITNIRGTRIFLFCLLCLIFAKALPHSSTLCFIRYFGYFTAFWIGICLKEIQYFEKKRNFIVMPILLLLSVGILLMNKMKIYILEIQYQPNSPEQLFFSLTLLTFLFWGIDKTKCYSKNFKVINIVNLLGNNAYGHFIWQYFVIKLVIYSGEKMGVNPVFTQLFIVLFVSVITVYCIVIPFNFIIQKITYKALS